jgi:hypothetical protein
MALFEQRATYDALAARLATLDLELMLGVPRAVQRLPAAYLLSTQVAGPPRTFGFITLRPTLTLVVNYHDAPAAEQQLIDLVDLVANDLYDEPLASVCKCGIESIGYDWRDIGGQTYRVADLVLVLSNG